MAPTDDAIKKSALLVATLSSFLTPLMGSSVNIALPSVSAEFSMSAVMLSWVATAFLLSAAMFLVPIGRIADIRGRKKVYAIGTSIYTLASLLTAFSTSGEMLIGFRVLQGFGSAMIFGTGIAILTSVYPPGERGRVLGITVAAVYAGLSIGPFFGGFMTQQFGWRSLFLAHVPIGILIIIVIIWKLKGEWAEAKGEKFDLPGSIVYALTLLSITYGVSLLPELTGVWTILVGLIGFGVFVYWERRTPSPIINVALFIRNRVFAFSNAAALIHYSATFAVTFLMSLYLQYIKGLSPQNAGLVLICQPIVMTIFSPIAGRLSDRIEPRVVASIGMAITTGALVLLTFIGDSTSLIYIIGCLMILGFGLALFSSPNTNAIMSSVERKYFGIASGSVGTMRTVGQVMSMGIAMLIFAVQIGKVEITPPHYPAFLTSARLAFAVFAALCLVGVGASLARGEIRPNQLGESAQSPPASN